ncbi:hypothetical protein LOD99_12026 [Oopsacas minuta]|uniref:Transposase n=1 Tax=Oopsacas minuta TaxID=111878 RepID=A0AAV7JHI5_9METZ|nr:hypothetical protein LOD99_12026 [Oopsacas minuta]
MMSFLHLITQNIRRTVTGHVCAKEVIKGTNTSLRISMINILYITNYSMSEMMRTARNAFYAFIRTKNNKLKRMGRTHFPKKHMMYLAWNAYLRLVDIDFNQNFSCPICQTSPDTIILGGVTLGTIRTCLCFWCSLKFVNRFPF